MKKIKLGKTAFVLWGATEVARESFERHFAWISAKDTYLVKIDRKMFFIGHSKIEVQGRNVTVLPLKQGQTPAAALMSLLQKQNVVAVHVSSSFPCFLWVALGKHFTMEIDYQLKSKFGIKTL